MHGKDTFFGNRRPATTKLIPFAVACAGIIFCPATVFSCACSEIAKPQAQRQEMDAKAGLTFMHSDEYKKQFAQAIEGAKAALEKHKGQPNLAIVSDIDETLLDNSAELAQAPESDHAAFFKWVEEGSAPTLKPTAELLASARQQGIAVFLVTGRRERERRATIENLLRDGVAFDGLYMRANDDNRPAEQMKTDYRAAIENMGFKIIVSIGDQLSDLWGGHAEDCEKLPNRMYYIP